MHRSSLRVANITARKSPNAIKRASIEDAPVLQVEVLGQLTELVATVAQAQSDAKQASSFPAAADSSAPTEETPDAIQSGLLLHLGQLAQEVALAQQQLQGD